MEASKHNLNTNDMIVFIAINSINSIMSMCTVYWHVVEVCIELIFSFREIFIHNGKDREGNRNKDHINCETNEVTHI